MSRAVRIIGAGFSGLTLGYFLAKMGVRVHVFEKSNRVGGLIATKKSDWGLSELAATGYVNSQLFERVMDDLGLACAERSPAYAKKFVYRKTLTRWPLTFIETFMFAKGVSRSLLGLAEPKPHQSARAWCEKYLGESAFQYLVGPALQGVYATQELNAELILNSMKRKSRLEKSKTRGAMAPVGGMQDLTDALARKIKECGGTIELNAEADLDDARPVVLAVPAKTAAVLLASDYPELARELARVDYLPVTTVTAAFAKDKDYLEGFGCLFSPSENFHALGVLASSSVFAGRAAEGTVVETWIFSGVHRADCLAQISDDRRRLLGSDSGDILHSVVTEWPSGIPHYNDQLLEFTKAYKCPPGVYLTGNYLGSIGLAKILENNYFLAMKIVENQ